VKQAAFFCKKEPKKLPAYQPSNTGLYNALFSCMILSVVEVSDAGVDEGHDGCGV
jgi:hypothetical protein